MSAHAHARFHAAEVELLVPNTLMSHKVKQKSCTKLSVTQSTLC